MDGVAVSEVVAWMLGRAPDSIHQVGGGGNNRLFRIDCGDAAYALKYYPADSRDRLGAEFAFLRFLASNGIDSVPRAIASAPDERVALYQWIDGVRPDALEPDELGAVFDFIGRLDDLREPARAAALPPASAACLTYGAAFEQLQQRLHTLAQYADNHPGLAEFLDGAIRPARDACRDVYVALLDGAGLRLQDALPREAWFLSPSDFGLHNMLRAHDGRLFFLDFEYAGWDDPAKFICDFVLHPGSEFSTQTQTKLLRWGHARFSPQDPTFALRLRGLIGAFGLIWCLIMLNVFIPEYWQRRQHAGQRGERDAVQQRQLRRAQQLYTQLREVMNVCQSL